MKPPAPPPSSRGFDESSSGRSRKDVNYVPVPSASLRAKPPLPSASLNLDELDKSHPIYDSDLTEDFATPTRTPNIAALAPTQLAMSAPHGPHGPHAPHVAAAAAPPPAAATDWQAPLPTGPMQPIAPPPIAQPPPIAPPAPIAAPPPSQRHFHPPASQPSFGAYPAASSARVRQPTPVDMQPYASQHGPASQQQITGPQMPVPMPPTSGSYPSASAMPASARTAPLDDGMPLGYVVASAFFLAIALVGFGLYLAFEVISL